jgi:hypothetical protein
VAHLDGAVVLEAHDAGDLLEPVAQARVLETEADADPAPASMAAS